MTTGVNLRTATMHVRACVHVNVRARVQVYVCMYVSVSHVRVQV